MSQGSSSVSSIWRALSEESAGAVEKSGGAVVAVHGRRRIPSSGLHVRPGIIVTADHALQRDEEITITIAGGQSASATLAGRDPGTDLAILKITDTSLPVAQAVRAADLKPGQIVLGVGRTLQGALRACLAMLAVAGPSWRTWTGGMIDQTVRLDRNLHPNFSGGAVIDHSGQVLGIATSAFSRFASVVVPVSTIERVSAELEKKGHVGRGYLGTGMQSVRLPRNIRESLKLEAETGVLIVSVEPDSPAEKAGIMLGDVLVAIDGNPLRDIRGVQVFLAGAQIGKSVKASLVRAGSLQEVAITLGERPSR
jgi:serine protease DegQ